ncbi:MAG: RagB/SusD family nutrient uptake outer membrane protein [Bacteroidota bacterium]|nr:RagB/SusD family nutrient uptake outer membrane protein [Bacteroidota bacterium]
MRYKKTLHKFPKLILLILLIPFILVLTSCKKYLDKKPSQNLAVPSSLADLQAILDNEHTNYSSPADLEFVADNYYLTSSSWNSSSFSYRNSYIWDAQATITTSNVWDLPYQAIYQANFVMDQLPGISISESDRNSYNNIKGTALFYRSFMFYQLAQLFCKPYSSSANSDLGIVLRLTSTITAPSRRSTVQETYNQVITDLKAAATLLPSTSLFVTRPNKAAAYGMLARVYLSMRDYTNASTYANLSLVENSSLLDYNSLAPSFLLPYFKNNPEISFLSYEGADLFVGTSQELIDSFLYQSYNTDDLRKTVYFAPGSGAGTYYWRGSYYNYGSTSAIFDGIATDEIYLIRAECYARNANKDSALADLNAVIQKRWKNTVVPYPSITALDANDALNKILSERRKELLYRGLRWSDLRRFNLDGGNITLKRIVNGTTYILPPNDLRWVLLIPIDEITRSGIQQNPR